MIKILIFLLPRSYAAGEDEKREGLAYGRYKKKQRSYPHSTEYYIFSIPPSPPSTTTLTYIYGLRKLAPTGGELAQPIKYRGFAR